MYGENQGYIEKACSANELAIAAPSLKEAIKFEIEKLEKKLESKRELLQLLEANPDFEKIMTLMRY